MTGRYASGLVVASLLVGLLLTRLYSYVLFHTLSELFSVVVACGVFLFAWTSRRFIRNNYLLTIGVAYLFVGTIDLLHTLAYKGMGVFEGYDTNLPTQLWVAARYLESLSLLIAPLLFGIRRLRAEVVVLAYSVMVAALVTSIFTGVFPVAFVEGAGLTPFKIASEYVICLVLVIAIALVLRQRERFEPHILHLLVWAIVATILTELAFTLYSDPYGGFNLLGHILKIISFFLLYLAILQTGLVKPYSLLLRDLELTNENLLVANARAQEQAEAAEAAQQRVNRILESITDAFLALDSSGRFVYANAGAERILRRRRAELVGMNISEAFPEAIGTTFEREYHRAIDKRESVAFVDFYAPLEAWIEVHGYPSPEGFTAYFRDVTARRLAEQERERLSSVVAQERALLESVMKGMGDGLVVLDSAHRVRLCNVRAGELLGIDPDASIGRHASEVFDQLEPPQPDLVEALRRGAGAPPAAAAQQAVEARVFAPPGRDLYAELFYVPKVGDLEPWVALLTRDLTGTRRIAFLEERHRIAMDLHDGTVQSLYGLTLALAARERTMGEQSGNARDALRSVRGQIQNVIAETRDYIQSLRSESSGLDGPVLRLALETLVDEIQRGGLIRAELELGPGADQAADPLVASSVLYIAREAVANAIRHAGASVVTIGLSQDEAGLALSVRDDGHGFDPQGQDASHGHGLRNMVERARAFGGTLVVLSSPDHGTEVRLQMLSPDGRAAAQRGVAQPSQDSPAPS